MVNTYNNILFPADSAGCGFYRMIFSKLSMQNLFKNKMRFIESTHPIIDPNFFKPMRMVRLQRQVANHQADYFLKFLKPLSEQIGFYLVYEIDDVICYDDIPKYNICKNTYNNEHFFNNVKSMISSADFVTVTTEQLKNYYVNKFNLSEDKFIVIPNYLPRWWIGESYHLDDIKKRFDKNRKRPRIAFPTSSSHIDINNQNDGIDDFSHIIDFIRSTVNKYEWIFYGMCPPKLKDLAQNKKITIVGTSDLLNYPRELYNLDVQAIIAPLQNNIFNNAKSNIKLLEGWALGIPVIAQNISTYSKYTDLTFNDSNDLQNKLDYLFNDRNKYIKIIKQNRNIVDYGDKNAKHGWWLEKNLQKYIELYTINQRTLTYDLTKSNENKLNLEMSK